MVETKEYYKEVYTGPFLVSSCKVIISLLGQIASHRLLDSYQRFNLVPYPVSVKSSSDLLTNLLG